MHFCGRKNNQFFFELVNGIANVPLNEQDRVEKKLEQNERKCFCFRKARMQRQLILLNVYLYFYIHDLVTCNWKRKKYEKNFSIAISIFLVGNLLLCGVKLKIKFILIVWEKLFKWRISKQKKSFEKNLRNWNFV